MREYGQVQCSFWTDPEIQALSTNAKLLACYLLTGPHSNGLGCYRLPDGYIQADFGWRSDTVSKGFDELFQIGFCERCKQTQFVLIPKFLRWNPVANPKVAIAREKEFRSVPTKSAIYQRLASSMATYGGHWSEGFAKHIETVSKGYAKQDPILPDPEPDPEPDPNTPPSRSQNREPDRAHEIHHVFEYWQQFMEHPRAKLDDKRRRKIRDRLKDGYEVEDLVTAIEGCAKSPHHMGENKTGTVYDDIELICRDGSHVDKFIKTAHDPDMTRMSSAARQTAKAASQWLSEGNS